MDFVDCWAESVARASGPLIGHCALRREASLSRSVHRDALQGFHADILRRYGHSYHPRDHLQDAACAVSGVDVDSLANW